MMMSTDLNTDVHGNFIIQLKGNIHHELVQQLEKGVAQLLGQYSNATIRIDFTKVDFVGSSAISNFVTLVNQVNRSQVHLRLKNVKKEFIKVFQLYGLVSMEDLFEEDEAPFRN